MPRRSMRSRVLEFVKSMGKSGATLEELTGRVEIHYETARRHLRALEKEGRIESVRLESEGMRGRPPNLYRYRK